MTPTLTYLDCCYPDYFKGASGIVIAVSVDSTTTVGELTEALLTEICADERLNDIGWPEDQSADLTAVLATFEAGVDEDDIVFPDAGEESYAYYLAT